MDRKIYALIPAYEPDKKLTELCRALTEAGCSVVVVDDGSDEGYAALFDGLEAAIVLTHIDNLGKGAALKTGLRYISEEGQPDDIVVTADADGRYTPEDILRVANAAKDAPDALALGCRSIGGQAPLRSRIRERLARCLFPILSGTSVRDAQTGAQYVLKAAPDGAEAASDTPESAPDALVLVCHEPAASIPLRSRLGNWIAQKMLRLLTGVTVHDTQTGLRAFSLAMLPLLLSVNGAHYEYEMNVLLDCAKGGVPIREIPVTSDRADPAELRMHALRDAGYALREALRFAAPTLASFTIDCAFFALFLQLTAATGRTALPLANTLARIVSASASFAIFRRIAPRDDDNESAALRHVLLSAGLLAASTALLMPLAEHMNIYEAKLAAEGALFAVNLLAQCLWQFKRS